MENLETDLPSMYFSETDYHLFMVDKNKIEQCFAANTVHSFNNVNCSAILKLNFWPFLKKNHSLTAANLIQ